RCWRSDLRHCARAWACENRTPGRRMKILPVIALSALLGACAENVELGSIESHVESANRLAVNRLAVNRLAVNRLAVNRLAVNRLAVNGMLKASADAEALAAEDGGLELLSY